MAIDEHERAIELQSLQKEAADRAYIDDWEQMLEKCPGFHDRLVRYGDEWVEEGLKNLFNAKSDYDKIIDARAMVVAGRAMQRLFFAAENINNELNKDEDIH